MDNVRHVEAARQSKPNEMSSKQNEKFAMPQNPKRYTISIKRSASEQTQLVRSLEKEKKAGMF